MSLILLLVEKAVSAGATTAGQVAGQAAPQTKAPNPMGSLLLFVVIFIGMYLLLMIPQQKRSKKEKLMREKIKEGDKILTTGGIIGEVKKVKEKSIIIETGKNGNQMEIVKTAIGQNITELQREQQQKQK
ncbi:preprotein translocase subunit YajC [bacterium]|nr:preprotein translocase subunit YajC [bacterium]